MIYFVVKFHLCAFISCILNFYGKRHELERAKIGLDISFYPYRFSYFI